MYHRDSGRRRFRGSAEATLRGPASASRRHPALFDARHDLHQRGFARAVFAQQQMDLAGLNREIAVFEGGDAAESLLDSAQFEEQT